MSSWRRLPVSALAAQPLEGATYRGQLASPESKISIGFQVASNGREVKALHVSNLPIYCSGSGPPAAKLVFQNAPIAASGTFTVKGRDAIGSARSRARPSPPSP